MENLHLFFRILNYKAEPSHPGVNVTYQQKIKCSKPPRIVILRILI